MFIFGEIKGSCWQKIFFSYAQKAFIQERIPGISSPYLNWI